MSQEPNIIQYLDILIRWKKFIIVNFLIVCVTTVLIVFLLPRWYKSTASLLPPKQSDIFGSLGASSSILKGIGSLSKLGGLGQKSSAYNYYAILNSRTTMENVIRKFDLIKVYDISDSSMEKTVKELKGNVAFEEQTDENITIEVLDKDPLRAADMANYFVQMLNEGSIRLGTLEARSNREFIEQRLAEVNKNLHETEESMRKFQERSAMIITPEQTSGVDAVATLYGMKAKKEIEVAIMERSVSPDSPILRQNKLELAELQKKLLTIPQVAINSLRLYRDMIIQQKILEFLVPIYEQAKIDERKDLPVLLVLDKAIPAERKSRPLRALIICLVSGLALCCFIPLTFLLQGLARKEDGPHPLERKLHNFARWIAGRYKVNLG
jgi:uncharacterized protein involved in exopolysaccharide biosynthesis